MAGGFRSDNCEAYIDITMTEPNEKTPLEAIIENAMFFKTTTIDTLLTLSNTVKDYDKIIFEAEKSLLQETDPIAIATATKIKQKIVANKAKFISDIVFDLIRLRQAVNLVNDQLHRQVPTEKRVTLLIDFDQLVKDCEGIEDLF